MTNGNMSIFIAACNTGGLSSSPVDIAIFEDVVTESGAGAVEHDARARNLSMSRMASSKNLRIKRFGCLKTQHHLTPLRCCYGRRDVESALGAPSRRCVPATVGVMLSLL
jgi:hypothetical protein